MVRSCSAYINFTAPLKIDSVGIVHVNHNADILIAAQNPIIQPLRVLGKLFPVKSVVGERLLLL